METTRDLFNKLRDTKGTFHAQMGTIMDRNGMDLTEFEEKDMHNNSTPVRKTSLDKMWRIFHPLDSTGVL